MATERRNLPLTITLDDLKNSIRNEENAGFLLRGMSITIGKEANQLVVEEGPPPAAQIEIQELPGATTPEEATKLALALHESLPLDAGVVAYGSLSIKQKPENEPVFVWVAAFRQAGMAVLVETPDAGVQKPGLLGAIVSQADEEWTFFSRQEEDASGSQLREGKKEFSDDGSERVARYWLVGTGEANLTGKNRDVPWSAAFISYLMAASNVGKLFRRASAHHVYIYAAIQAKTGNKTDYGYWGFPLTEQKPEVGDLVCAWRKTDTFNGPVTYEKAAGELEYPSHCDLVVEVTADSIAVIGGNVDQSVTKRHFKLDKGFLLPSHFPNGFAILKNRMKDMAAAAVVLETKPAVSAEAAGFQQCSTGWELTGYFTPLEKDYSGATESVKVTGLGTEAFAGSFLKNVRMEGWGRTRFGWYLGYSAGAYQKSDFAQDALGQALVIGSVAVDRKEIPFKRQLTLPDLPDEWGKTIYTAVDVGGAINQKHIDVYCGEGAAAEKMTSVLTIKSGSAKFPKMARVCFA
jgi:3D (Asp-Asp-Asp) domain-containing protein